MDQVKIGEFISALLKERITYYKKKWLKEHVPEMVLMGLSVAAVFLGGLHFENWLLTGASFLLLIFFHCVRNHRMMVYVEQHAYDGTGK